MSKADRVKSLVYTNGTKVGTAAMSNETSGAMCRTSLCQLGRERSKRSQFSSEQQVNKQASTALKQHLAFQNYAHTHIYIIYIIYNIYI